MKQIFVVTLAVTGLWYPALAEPDNNVSELPDYIKAPASRLALVADFDHSTKGAIPVYLINRSGKDIRLMSQDGDVYLKLEYQDSSGAWKRAQPHAYSWCGNSYVPLPLLRNDCFIIVEGYQPAQGESAAVRFRFYGDLDLASNVGQGLIRREDVQRAENDAMAVRRGDFAFVSSVARGERILQNTMDHLRNLRSVAILELGQGRFDRAKSEEVLREIVASKDEPYGQLAQVQLNALNRQAGRSQ